MYLQTDGMQNFDTLCIVNRVIQKISIKHIKFDHYFIIAHDNGVSKYSTMFFI